MCRALVALSISVLLDSTALSAQAVEFRVGPAPQILNFDTTRGWLFTVHRDLKVTAIGLWDHLSDGFASSHAVTIATADGDMSLVSTSIPAGTSAAERGRSQGPGIFRYRCIEPTLLSAGSST